MRVRRAVGATGLIINHLTSDCIAKRISIMEETKNVVTNENFDWNAYENDLGVYDHPKEEIAEAYDKTLSNVNVGEVVEGTVTGITKREVIVEHRLQERGCHSRFRVPLQPRPGGRREGRGLRGVGRGQERPAGRFRTRRRVSSNRGIASTRRSKRTKSSRVTSSAAPRAV